MLRLVTLDTVKHKTQQSPLLRMAIKVLGRSWLSGQPHSELTGIFSQIGKSSLQELKGMPFILCNCISNFAKYLYPWGRDDWLSFSSLSEQLITSSFMGLQCLNLFLKGIWWERYYFLLVLPEALPMAELWQVQFHLRKITFTRTFFTYQKDTYFKDIFC